MGAFGSYRTMDQSPRTLLPFCSLRIFSKELYRNTGVGLHPGLWNDSLLDDIPVICDFNKLST